MLMNLAQIIFQSTHLHFDHFQAEILEFLGLRESKEEEGTLKVQWEGGGSGRGASG